MKLKNEILDKKWSDYHKMRLAGNKKTANKLLNDFIQSILGYDKVIIEDFVYQVCSIALKDKFISNNGTEVSNTPIRIQHQLFQKVILPILIQKYKEKDPLYIRWIAQFEQFFYSDHKTTNRFLEEINDEFRDAVQYSSEKNEDVDIKCRYFSTVHFLIKSFKISPDPITLNLILERLAQDIYYKTHELPNVILADADVFMEEINQFKYYYEKSDNKNKWTKQVKEWEYIANHWKIYLKAQDKFSSFEEYLTKNEV